MTTTNSPTVTELVAEAVRLDEPFHDTGEMYIGQVGHEGVIDHAHRRGVAALTLAVFAEWDAGALRAAAAMLRGSEHDGADVAPPSGFLLLVAAARISESSPADRARFLETGA